MTIENPPVFEHGFVVGRFVTAVADTLADDDRYPDLLAIEGRVRFTPLQTVHLKGGEHPATVVKQPITARLNAGGYVADVVSMDGRIQPATPQNAPDVSNVEDYDPDDFSVIEGDDDPTLRVGNYLAVGLYRVEPIFDNVSSISRFTIEVTAEHTKDAPLDLTLAAPLETPPGFTEVVRIIDRVRAEEAAEAAEGHTALALVYRDEAAQSAASAESHADRAEEARDEALGNAIEVDTSVGTRVYVGGVMVHGDTGWRDITSRLPDGITPSTSTNANFPPAIRRISDTIYLEMFVDTDGGTRLTGDIPAGFRPSQLISRSGILWTASTKGASLPGHQAGWYLSRAGGVRSNSSLPSPGTALMSLNWTTTDSWPTSLPGTPA